MPSFAFRRCKCVRQEGQWPIHHLWWFLVQALAPLSDTRKKLVTSVAS